MKKTFTILLAITLLFVFTACNQTKKSENLSENTGQKANKKIEKELENVELTGSEGVAITDFSLEVLKKSVSKANDKNKNILISPLSIVSALGMVENGAAGETLKQMENTIGINLANNNKFFKNYMDKLSKEEKQALYTANSIWIKKEEGMTVSPDFIQINKDFYNAEIYKANFDSTTLNDINNWVNEKTDKMIPKILERIEEDSFMYLINAITFKSDWDYEYDENDVFDSQFTLENGEKQDIEMMFSEENVYMENENSKGVIKYYKDRKYAFVALLPNEGIKINDYLNSLNGNKIQDLIKNSTSEDVITNIPKFKTEFGTNLNETLKEMGIENAFYSSKADFSKILSENGRDGFVYISNVIHKTFIEVDEKGTKAAAATVVEMSCDSCAPMEEEEPKEVILNRPFVYMIYDLENDIPVFMGTVMSIK